jgi:ADP-ribosyl-[dinitrogen reductase] hydrolase
LSPRGKAPGGETGIVDRARAALFGVAVGDALGATTEFMTPAEIRDRYGVLRDIVGGGWLKLSPGQVTDDTEMTLCVARGIVGTGRWDLKPIADRFARWLSGNPPDVGATCRRGIEEYVEKGRLEAPLDGRSAGNGAAMRVAPVALYTLGDEELLSRLAVEQARITHHHPLSDAACVAVGTMIQRGLLGAPARDLRAAAESLAARHPEFRLEGYDGKSSGYVVDTLLTVFDAFFSTDDFEECVVKTVNRGGDADTAGSIAGAIAGARYGVAAIPQRWLRALDPGLREELAALAGELVRKSPLFAGTSPRRTGKSPPRSRHAA